MPTLNGQIWYLGINPLIFPCVEYDLKKQSATFLDAMTWAKTEAALFFNNALVYRIARIHVHKIFSFVTDFKPPLNQLYDIRAKNLE